MASLAFCTALGCISFTAIAQGTIMEQGLMSIDDLFILGKQDIRCICKIICYEPDPVIFCNSSYLRQSCIIGSMHSHLGQPTVAMLFSMQVAQEYAMKMVAVNTEETEMAVKETSKMPDKFKQLSKWLVFKEAIKSAERRRTHSPQLCHL